ncbi:MAG: type II toxin-antitoxin system PemK/MazF family toxin [Candidatus Hydrothermarchaeota archaeon]|nr:MAG: type II toxin-antitoxin system PemK/MazF family toxin [Candidatus Hydrothermarchaeota archaeon]
MKGKIVLVPFPFTDLTASKLRPALVIHEGEKDVIVAFISSKIPETISEYEAVVRKSHPEFKYTGLKVDSIIRLDKVATILKDLVIGELGEIGDILKQEINEKLEKIFRFK